MKSAPFWDITERRVVIIYWRFGTTYRSHIHGSRSSRTWPLKMGPIGCPETSAQNYHSTPRNNPEAHRSHRHCSGSLKSRINSLQFSKNCLHLILKHKDIQVCVWCVYTGIYILHTAGKEIHAPTVSVILCRSNSRMLRNIRHVKIYRS